jgi:3-methylcrotonyl-CoA carboxylase alpha subunit
VADTPVSRLLIANRGEIVRRITRTASRLGWTSIAVYSDADADALHVREADEAYRLGPAPAAQSYLDAPRIIELARRVGAEAVHPGYGFLSENAEFAESCHAAGLVFVGPPARAMRAMGSKSAAKAAMAAAGVPVAPGYHGEDQTPERLAAEAARVGFPLIIKASAGGGGKGMQVVRGPAELAAAVASAKRLARTAFGDDRVLLERYFPKARHVEVQVFADAHGTAVALFDRDCSVQRRHQKIIEEAPAPGLDPRVRDAMAQAAVTVARTVGYVGAGTVEFLLDPEQHFYFMEMNTRLQVEHPVTEEITGLDLVEWQLRVARGERLPQPPAAPRGVAIEARLYAEDPAHEYLPSAGRIEHLHWPAGEAGVRLDVGVQSGDEVPPFYDPMLGKLIAYGDSRREAIARLHRALGGLEIVGITTNRALLKSVLADPVFVEGPVYTDFLELRRGELAFAEPSPQASDLVLAALWYASGDFGPDALWADTTGWRLGAPARTRWRFGAQEVTLESAGAQRGEGSRCAQRYLAHLAGSAYPLALRERSADALSIELEGRRLEARIVDLAGTLHVFCEGRHVMLRAAQTEDALQASSTDEGGSLATPLPGTVVAVHVEAGQSVAAGAPLITVEAMKMEHTLKAPRAGTVERLPYAVGDRVAGGAVLVEFTAS